MEVVQNAKSFSKEECVKWLTELGLSHTGTLDDLKTRVALFARTPKLVQKLKARAQRQYTFKCSLDASTIPPSTAQWSSDENLYPKISPGMISSYLSHKREGSIGQQQKGHQFTAGKLKMSRYLWMVPKLMLKQSSKNHMVTKHGLLSSSSLMAFLQKGIVAVQLVFVAFVHTLSQPFYTYNIMGRQRRRCWH